MALFDWVNRKVFTAVHGNNLVYNTCWEDPRLDRVALDFGPVDLKIAGIKNLDFDTFFKMFGEGRLPGVQNIYQDQLRDSLPAMSQQFWDKKINWFDNRRKTFYDRGTSGTFARLVRIYNKHMIKATKHLDEMLEADTVEQQKEIYEGKLKKKFWSGVMKFAMNRDTTMSMLGVPKAQRHQIDTQYPGVSKRGKLQRT